MDIYLPRDTIMSWAGTRVTEHGRAALSISPEQIETKSRTVSGTLRKHTITTKNTYSVSWENVRSVEAVDGFMAGKAMLDFYLANQGAFALTLRFDGNDLSKTVMFSNFSYEISKRGINNIDLLNISADLEEV